MTDSKASSNTGRQKHQTVIATSTLALVATLVFSTTFETPEPPTPVALETANTPATQQPQLPEDSPATLKTAEIRQALTAKYEAHQRHALHQDADLSKTHDHASEQEQTTSAQASSQIQKEQNDGHDQEHHHDHHQHEHEHDHEHQASILHMLSPEVIEAVNQMTHQTEEGTQLIVRDDGNLTVDMGDNAFRAVPVATVDETGKVTITEFFEPIDITPLFPVNQTQ